MPQWIGRNAPHNWWIFLAVALILCLLCFVSSDHSRSILWPSYKESLRNWPSTTDSWILDTQTNYSAQVPPFNGSSERVYDFNVSEITVPLAGIMREVITINNQFPGPLIEAVEGDTIIVRLRNQMHHKETSLHFHGQAMNHTNFNDGAVGMTQCGISPGKSFEYRFVAGPSGTFWYHSHAQLQALQGFVGPMIVYSRQERQSQLNEEQRVLLLSDFYDKHPDDLMDSYLEPWIGGSTEPIPGIAVAQGSLTPEIIIPYSRLVRLRVVNAASFTAFKLQLGSSKQPFQVLEADSTAIVPTFVDSLIIYPAQRYSIVVEIDQAEWLFSTPVAEFYDDAATGFQALNYTSSSLKTLLRNSQDAGLPKSSSALEWESSEHELVDRYFEPLESTRPLPDANITKYVDITMDRTEEGVMAGAINGNVFSMEGWRFSLADLLDESGKLQPRHDVPHHTHKSRFPVISTEPQFPQALLQTNDWLVADFIIRNYDDGFHPMHLHGHDVWIMERGTLDNSTRPISWPLPLKRDVVGVPQNEWVRIRVVLDNPGVWWFHCHIPWHSVTGMRTAIISQPQKLRSQNAPHEWWQLCQK